jgi:hypothetical protein
MKLKSIALACSGALAAIGNTQTWAQAPFDTPQITIYVTGASAPQNTIGAIATGLFNAGFNTYFDNAGTAASPSIPANDGRLYRAYFGTVRTDPSIPASLHGRTAMIINRAKGGSGWGVQPVALGAPIATLGISAANCVLNGGIYRCGEVGSDSSANPANQVPDAGVSDVAPRFFLPPLNVEPQFPSALTPAQLASLTIRPLQGLGMGVVATTAVAADWHDCKLYPDRWQRAGRGSLSSRSRFGHASLLQLVLQQLPLRTRCGHGRVGWSRPAAHDR